MIIINIYHIYVLLYKDKISTPRYLHVVFFCNGVLSCSRESKCVHIGRRITVFLRSVRPHLLRPPLLILIEIPVAKVHRHHNLSFLLQSFRLELAHGYIGNLFPGKNISMLLFHLCIRSDVACLIFNRDWKQNFVCMEMYFFSKFFEFLVFQKSTMYRNL